jgi:hypothetical protein
MLKLKTKNAGKKILAFFICIGIAAVAVANVTGTKTVAYGRNGNWDIYNSDGFKGNYNLNKIALERLVKNNPSSQDDNKNTHVVKTYMDLYDQTYNSYTVVNSLSDGKPIGDSAIPETDSDPKLPNEYLYLNTTLFTDSNGQKKVSAWYNSTYGPLIDSEVGNPSEISQEEDSVDFASLLFPEESDRVYVASTEPSYHLRDAKTVATLYGAKYPILFSNSNDSSLAGKLSSLKAKHVIFLGGTGSSGGPAAFDSLAGIGTTGTDMVRIGGTSYAQTARFMQQLPSSVYDAPEQPENNLGKYYSLSADSSVSSNVVDSISQKLQNNDFTGAVKLALANKIGNSNPHAETNVQSGISAFTIGGFDGDTPPTGDQTEDAKKEKYLKIYLCDPSTGQLVMQYFEAGFKFVPTTPNTGMVNLTINVSPRDAGTVTLDGKASEEDGSVTENKKLENGKAAFKVTQTPSTKAPKESHWEFDHWGVLDGDNVTPDNSGNVAISKSTTLVAYYKLIPDAKDKIYGDESSILTVKATVDAAWYRKGEPHKASDTGATIAKEGQRVTFTVNTSSDDYRYPITDSRGWQDAHTPDYLIYNQNGFYGILYGQGEESHDFGHWHHHHDDDYWVSHWMYRQDYKGTIYRSPVQYFSAQRLQFTFPDGISHTTGKGLNSALKDNTNLVPITPYMEWYIQSTPTFSSRYTDGQIWKYNTEKVDFDIPLTTPITIKDNGVRIRDPYIIKIHAIETNGYITADTTVELDVKGNIYQGIYTTPIG